MHKEHFKLYKSGKNWCVMAIATLGVTLGVATTVNADATVQSPTTHITSEQVFSCSQSNTIGELSSTSGDINNSSFTSQNTSPNSVKDAQKNITPNSDNAVKESKTGWQQENGWTYYENGKALTGRNYSYLSTIGKNDGSHSWYLVDNGVAQSGVQSWAGTYYYFDPVTHLRVDNDYRQSQWGLWYMFGHDGRIVTKVYQWADTYYYFDPTTYLRVDNDYRQSQWGDWYLFGNDGRIQSGVQQWGGTYYYFDPTTYLRVDNDYRQSQWGDWYMFGPDGRIVSGFWNWHGNTYYFDPSTYLKVTNAWVGDSYFGFSGARIDGFNYKNATYLEDSILHKTDGRGNIINIFDPNKFPNLSSISVDGDLAGITKDNKKVVKLKLNLTDGTNANAWATIKWQGNSSLQWPKKGYRLKLFKDQALTEKYKIKLPDSGYATNSFNLKGCFTDPTIGLNIVNSRIFAEVTKSRPELKDSIVDKMPNYGQVNGLPVEFGINGLDQGLYVLETYHEDKLYGLNDKKTNNIALSANYDAPSTAFKAKVSAADLKDTIFSNISPAKVEDSVAKRFNELYDLANASDQEYSSLEDKYLDVPAAIDYLAFSFAINNQDGLRKNITYVAKKNSKWTIIPYDLDSTWDNDFDSSKKDVTANFENEMKYRDNKLLLTFYAHHKQDIINRYKELRQNVLSEDNINSMFKNWFNSIGPAAYANNNDLWRNIGVDHRLEVSLKDVTSVVNQRLKAVDQHWGI